MKSRIFSARKICCVTFAAMMLPAVIYSQTVFFKSQQAFSSDQLSRFYSSVTIEDDLVLFTANDYSLYAYSKSDGSLKWTCETSYKSNMIPFVSGNKIFASDFIDNQERAIEIDIATGKILKALPFGSLATRPFIKDNILFGTAIYDAGCIIAYDLVKDTVLWSRFLAHGYSRQPYYFEKTIHANAESDNWVEINYHGELIDTNCKTKADIYIENIPCAKKYYGLTHDRKEIKGKIAEKIFGKDFSAEPEIFTTDKNTFILHDGILSILGNKLKLKQSIPIPLDDSIIGDIYSPEFLVKADAETVSLVHSNHLIIYDHHHKTVRQLIDLSAWAPHRVLIDEDKLWLISSKDGLLYGLTF
jgi:hypothetical protein